MTIALLIVATWSGLSIVAALAFCLVVRKGSSGAGHIPAGALAASTRAQPAAEAATGVPTDAGRRATIGTADLDGGDRPRARTIVATVA